MIAFITRHRSARPALAGVVALVAAALPLTGCRSDAPADRVRVTGYIEASEVQVAPEVAGRLIELAVDEGARVAAGDRLARLDTTQVELALGRARADRDVADAQLRLLLAGARAEDLRQAEAQVAAAEADLASVRVELAAADTDLGRFESLLETRSGSEKQRDDAATRRNVGRERVRAADHRVAVAREALARLRAGARREEIDAARARLAAANAQIATLDQNLADATLTAPVAGLVTQKLADVGELLAPRTPLLTIADLDHAWANVYLDEPLVPRVRLGQPADLFTDAGGPGVQGTVSFISPKAEFTPRNVQTSEERSKLVYRLKITIDNRAGVFKQGMPVEADLPLAPVTK